VNPTLLLEFSHSEVKSLQVPLMGLPELENNIAGLSNHTHIKPTIPEIEINTPKRHDHINSKKLTVKSQAKSIQ